jgi:predicted RNase H-like nuclease (RuvC/YqgF family)
LIRQILTEEENEESEENEDIEENEEIEDKNVDKHSWKTIKNESKKSSKEAKNEVKQASKKEKDEAKKAWKEEKRKLEAQKDELKSQKDELEKQKKELKKQLREANKAGNLELVVELRQKINESEKQISEIKQEIKECKFRIRNKIRESYDEEEIKAFEEVASKIKEKHKGIKVLPFDCVIARGRSLKFDTPPVIKDGRTLIPVRAISEGFEAKVVWNAEERTVTVTKGDKEMVLKVGSVVAYINGVETRLDVSAEILNGRTVIPLRFIIVRQIVAVYPNG